jgi:hypothetical protein
VAIAPILRLAAETVTIDAGPADPAYWSDALYLAVVCHDYPQLWDFSTPIADRRAEAESRIAAYPPGTFLPFSASAWNGADYEGVFACLRWPAPARPDPPDPPGAVYPDVPTLVLNGDLDTITASSGAPGGRAPFPELHLRRGCELDTRHRARRLGSLRLADLRPLRPRSGHRGHVLHFRGRRVERRAAVRGLGRRDRLGRAGSR